MADETTTHRIVLDIDDSDMANAYSKLKSELDKLDVGTKAYKDTMRQLNQVLTTFTKEQMQGIRAARERDREIDTAARRERQALQDVRRETRAAQQAEAQRARAVERNARLMQAAYQRVAQGMRQIGSGAGQIMNAVNPFNMLKSQVLGMTTAVFSAATAYWALKRGIDAVIGSGMDWNATMETSLMGFRQLIGKASEADALFKGLVKESIVSPFETKEILKQGQQLLASGFSPTMTRRMLDALGNTVAAMGGDQDLIGRLVLAMNQIKARGSLAGDEARQLYQARVPIYDILSQKLGKSGAEILTMQKKKQLESNMVINSVIEYMEQRFAGMKQNLLSTLTGATAALKDTAMQASGSLITPLTSVARTAALTILPMMTQWQEKYGEVMTKTGDWEQASKAAFKSVAETYNMDFVENIGDFMVDGIRNVSTIMERFISQIRQGKTPIQAMKSALRAMVYEGFGTDGVKKFDEIVNRIKQIGDGIKGVVNWFDQLPNSVKTAIVLLGLFGDKIVTIASGLDSMGSRIFSAGGAAAGGGGAAAGGAGAAGGVAAGMASALPVIFAVIAAIGSVVALFAIAKSKGVEFGGMFSGIGDMFKQGWENAKKFGDGVKEGFDAVWEGMSLTDSVQDSINNFKTAFDDLAKAMGMSGEAGKGFGQVLGVILGVVITVVAGFVKVISWLTKIYASWTKLKADILGTLASGIGSMFGGGGGGNGYVNYATLGASTTQSVVNSNVSSSSVSRVSTQSVILQPGAVVVDPKNMRDFNDFATIVGTSAAVSRQGRQVI